MMSGQLSLDLQVPFNTQREANIAWGTLSVDPEPKRGGCKKTLTVKDTVLHVHLEAQEARSLRVGMNSFLDHLNLVVNTIEQFGPPRPVDTS
ncbi:EKC/KEOPS complex subunit Lage3-like [Mercenaria mercenaria]|uniref:EKC/KEOPS complex subunit Lage3-like n=1 Tax=Mercenaria mercenaria TaxID=6596 RepID=UPI00234F08A1|nr:EKC/KEOPS complex subunit Lage3-like [Mercenaria mercenaria]